MATKSLKHFIRKSCTKPRKKPVHVETSKKNKNKSRKDVDLIKNIMAKENNRVDINPNIILHCRYERKNNNN